MGFNVWDTAGDQRFTGLADGYYINADAAIFFVDNTAESRAQLKRWHRDFRRVCKEVPCVVCSNKIYDVKESDDFKNTMTLGDEQNVVVFPTDAKHCFNVDKPFAFLARLLLDDQTVRLVESPPLKPPIINVAVPSKGVTKIAVIGNAGAGKTLFVKTFTNAEPTNDGKFDTYTAGTKNRYFSTLTEIVDTCIRTPKELLAARDSLEERDITQALLIVDPSSCGNVKSWLNSASEIGLTIFAVRLNKIDLGFTELAWAYAHEPCKRRDIELQLCSVKKSTTSTDCHRRMPP